MTSKTSWGKVGGWYHELLQGEGTYQSDLILPNILRILEIKEGETILDLACGDGFFSREYIKHKADVIGVDIASELIKIARLQNPEASSNGGQAKENSSKSIQFHVSEADDLKFIKDSSIDKISIILAIQNIENMQGVWNECKRVLKDKGKLCVVLNHPAFRIPKKSSWGFDAENDIQYRRVDAYMSSSKEIIEMEPGKSGGEKTVSFHRPLQMYFKSLVKAGFLVSRFEEWTSSKKSQEGPRRVAEDRSRKEIPLFLMIEAINK